MMSTADSQLLVTSSVLSEDIFHRLLRKNAGETTLLAVSRYLTITVGIIAFILALTSKELVFALVSFAWCGLGASFGPALLLTLWWRKITRAGVLAGMITGSVTTVIWSKIAFLRALMTERTVAFVLAFAAVILVSLISNRKEKG